MLTAAIGVVVGLPALRLSRIYPALVTLAFAQFTQLVMIHWDNFTLGAGAFKSPAPSFRPLPLGTEQGIYDLSLMVAATLTIMPWNITRSRIGQAFVAIRDSAVAAQMFLILYERRSQKAGALSGAQQRMLAIGRALMARPRLLLMDEPSAGRAPVVVQNIMRLIRELRAAGQTILLVEQNIGVAPALASQAYVLKDGQNALAGDAATLLHKPEVMRSYLGG